MKISASLITCGTSAVAIICAITSVYAQDMPFPPPQAKICTSGPNGLRIVNKRELARYLLTKYPVSVAAASNVQSNAAELPTQILSTPDFCKRSGSCSKSDESSLQSVTGNVSAVLAGLTPGYAPTKSVDPSVYFQGSDEKNAIVCQQSPTGAPIEAPGSLFAAPSPVQSNFRVRGKVDDLYIDRSQKDFNSASQATISVAGDGVKGQTTETFQGVLGYRINTGVLSNGQRLDIIPYAQVNRVLVNPDKGSSAKPSATETFDFGVTASAFFIAPNGPAPVGHVLNVRPDFLFDTQDHSRIASLNFQYIPVLNRVLNDYIRISPDRDDLLSIKPIVDFRVDLGYYADRGVPTVAVSHKDYARIGGQAGINLVSDNNLVPLSFTTSYTGLYGAAGNKNIGYFYNNLSWALDPNKYYLLSASYTNGTREDTAKREQLWSVGLSLRF